jgi:hypothetical protein
VFVTRRGKRQQSGDFCNEWERRCLFLYVGLEERLHVGLARLRLLVRW